MLLAQRGYDADWIRELAMEKGAWVNIPPKSNRWDPICFSPYLYRARNQVERFFNKGQTLPSGGDALRQARCHLPCLRSSRVNHAVAAP
jgi:transposase